MKQGGNIKNIISFTYEEEKLLKKYLEEYNELYQKILILSPKEFIRTMVKRVEITMKEKFNGFSNNTKSKIEDFIIEKIYCHDYKYALFVKKNILKRKQDKINSHYFNNEIIPHCDNDKKKGYYVHICGEKFQTFKYKPIINSPLIYKKKKYFNNNEPEYLLYCMECDMIYKSDLIRFKCHSSNECFYSRILDKNDLINNNQLVTWKKYHCNIIINDAMKCQKCNENLYYLQNNKNAFCKKCNIEFNPKDLIWKCMKCKCDFVAEIKIYNPLEYKNMKICIKETLFNKKKAKPKYLACGCKVEFQKLDFLHKNSCNGKLFLGELNEKKVVICSKCESIGMYDDYIWTCPKCLKRFKINDKEEKEEKEKKEEKEDKNKIKKDEQMNKPINRFFNYSNSNWNIKITNNNVSVYKSPIEFKNKFLFPPKNDSLDNDIKTEFKNLAKLCRNNSALKYEKKKCPSGIHSPSKIIKEMRSIYNVKIDNKNNIKTPKYSPEIFHSKCESKIIENNIKSSRNNYKFQRSNRLISNIDLSEIKNIHYLFDKYFDGSPLNNDNKKLLGSDNEYNKSSREIKYPKNKCKNNLFTDVDLEEKVEINMRLKSNIGDNSKIVNQATPNNIKSKIRMVRCNSGCNRIKINTDEPIPYNKNILKNNEINSGKIPIKKKINNYRGKSFNRRGESTSCDSNEKIIINKDTNKKIEENCNYKNKKIIPGKFNINHYIIKKQIGQGTFGQIFLVEDKNNHNKYALKKIIAGSSNDINNIQKEYQILLDIQNNVQDINVVNIFGLSKYKLDITTYVLYVLMELASTDWEKEILSRKATRKYYSEKELIKILSSLIKSLSILEKQNISHRDIKPQNVLVFYDKYLNKIYKLADFGEAKELLKDEKPTNKQTLRGTELYMSPILFFALRGRKVMKYIKHNPYKSDVFSFGLCALFAATLCFESLYDVRELKSNVSLRVVVEKYLRFRYSQDIISIITKMLDVNETTRMDFIELEKEFNKFQI